MNEYCLGIDTSAYTTSLCLMNHENQILYDLRESLNVQEGKLGLRQQEAVFQHLNNLPRLIKILSQDVDFKNISKIAVSYAPRNTKGSYMPVFKVGENIGCILASTKGVKLKRFSHQEGHIGAGFINHPEFKKTFLSIHISGGTTELLKVDDGLDNYSIINIGGTLDMSFGQLIDRIGVYLGYGFPSGHWLEILSRKGSLLEIDIPIKIKDVSWINISGLENFFKNLIEKNQYAIEDIILTLFHTIALAVEELVMNVNSVTKHDVLVTGGIASNIYIRELLVNNLSFQDINVCFPDSRYCTDNAVGIAYLGNIKNGHAVEAFNETFKGK